MNSLHPPMAAALRSNLPYFHGTPSLHLASCLNNHRPNGQPHCVRQATVNQTLLSSLT